MKTTAYRTKEYILKDLLAKHYRTIDNLNDIANIGRTLSLSKLKKLDQLLCKFNDNLNDIANKCLENIEKNK